jgi:NADH-quinone oxidoreductase subunit C
LLNNKQNIKKNNINWNSINSITELFLNANWLEREVAELHGIFFSNKKDLRNLMLPYGDTSAPMRKSFPSIGVKEVFYDSLTDLLIQNPVSIQF